MSEQQEQDRQYIRTVLAEAMASVPKEWTWLPELLLNSYPLCSSRGLYQKYLNQGVAGAGYQEAADRIRAIFEEKP